MKVILSRSLFKSISTAKLNFQKVVRSRHTSKLASGSSPVFQFSIIPIFSSNELLGMSILVWTTLCLKLSRYTPFEVELVNLIL